MARKTQLRRLKKLDVEFTVFIMLCLVAAGSLIYTNSSTGMVVNRNMISFSERLCPNPAYPVPVLGEEVGGLGHKQVVKCVSKIEEVQSQGSVFPVSRVGDVDYIQFPAD